MTLAEKWLRELFASYAELSSYDSKGHLHLFEIAEYVQVRKAGQAIDDKGNLICSSAYVHPTAQVKNSIIGPNASIYEYVTVRDSLIEANSVVGHCGEVARSIIGKDVSLPRFNYIGGSIIGRSVRVGGCVSTATRRFDDADVMLRYKEDQLPTHQRKFGALIGDGTIIGFASHLNPGVVIGRRCLIGPYTDLRRDVPDDYIIVSDQKLSARVRGSEDFHARK
jgi:bifunctional UDP-N-acetylglucosamine pyrophosphorylase/glucosamine-1-phosphate N-acetyltransferase